MGGGLRSVMDQAKTLELLEALQELFEYGFPVYRDSLLLNDGLETFGERVEELLNEPKGK